MERKWINAGIMLLVSIGLTACRTAPAAKASVEDRLTANDRLGAPSTSPEVRPGEFVGFDRNVYPGDDRLAELRRHFAFTGFWLNLPPGADANTWSGKRRTLVDAGFGFLVLFNGRVDADIKRSRLAADTLGRQDAADAIAATRREGFPDQTIVFLDQEEGGRLLPEQAAYFFAWTEAVSTSAFRPGAYLSGQPSEDGVGTDGKPLMITTAQDVREHVAAQHLHPVVFWVAQDTCPPSPGCTVQAPRLRESGTLDATVWQFAQSPRRPAITQSCAKTYAADGLCYAGVSSDLFVDLNVANSADPSHGR